MSQNISKTEIGTRFRQIRKRGNLTQIEFAKPLEITPSTVSQIEKGSMLPSIELIVKVIKLYDTTFDYLILGQESSISNQADCSPENITYLKQTIKALEESNVDKQKLIHLYEEMLNKN